MSCQTCLIVDILKEGTCIKQLRCFSVRIGHRPPVCLGTTHLLEQKPAPPEDGSITPLASSSSTSFWIMGWWVATTLTLNCWKLWNKGALRPKLKMVTLNHIKHKPVRCNASPLIQKFEKHTNLKNCRWTWWGGWGPGHIRCADTHRPLSS